MPPNDLDLLLLVTHEGLLHVECGPDMSTAERKDGSGFKPVAETPVLVLFKELASCLDHRGIDARLRCLDPHPAFSDLGDIATLVRDTDRAVLRPLGVVVHETQRATDHGSTGRPFGERIQHIADILQHPREILLAEVVDDDLCSGRIALDERVRNAIIPNMIGCVCCAFLRMNQVLDLPQFGLMALVLDLEYLDEISRQSYGICQC